MNNKEQAYQILYKELEKGFLFDYNQGEVDIGYVDMVEFITNKMIEFSEIQNKKLLEFKESFIRDFEDDFVWEDRIVDNPENRWTCLPNLYKQAKNI